MSHSDPDIELRVKRDRLDTLYKETGASALATLLVMAAFAFVLSTHLETAQLLTWYAFLTLVLLGRGLAYLHYLRFSPEGGDIDLWYRRFRLGVLATGLTVGATSILFFPGIPVPYEIFSIFVLAGISAGALTVLICDYRSFYLYINATLLPAAITSLRHGDSLHVAIGVMTLIYIILLMRASRNLYHKVNSSLLLGYENQVLAERLRQEKNHLDNRLGRILSDGSSEIYVIDTSTLRYLQVNRGALQHLGYSEEEIRRCSVLDILYDLDREEFDDLMEPLYSRSQDYIFFHGHHRRRDGSSYPVEVRLQLSQNETPPVIIATALDITEHNEAKRQLIHQANFDQLTDLPNRYFMLPHIEHAFARAKRTQTKVALLFLDLDDFKKVNDNLGHCMGDILLKEAADRIRSVIRESDIAARLGGDEFLVLLEGITENQQVEQIADKLVSAFKQPFRIGSNEAYTSTSIGISLFPDDGGSVAELMQYADMALYYTKQNGRCNYHYFSDEMRDAWTRRLEMEAHLRRALDNGEMSLLYQPKVDALNGRILGAEALLRWTNPALGVVSPELFIPLAENLGLIGTIGSWVLEEACREAMQWLRIADNDVQVAVNVSSHQFRSGRLVRDVEQALEDSGLPPGSLELEITESLLIQDTGQPVDILNRLRERGVSLSLDDFGTGYSSLSYLKRFPLQTLKIDRSFVQGLTVDKHSDTLVETIIAMANSLDLEIVAEGVENSRQLAFLSKRDVRIIQGYYFSPPVTATEFRDLLKNRSLCREGVQAVASG